jgi:hypothetical protein
MNLIADRKDFPHSRKGDKFISTCRVRVFQDENGTVVIASETGNGRSVTNGAEEIATGVVKEFGLNPDFTTFIEHYPADQTAGNEEWDLVHFTTTEPLGGFPFVLISPQWERIKVEEVNKLCGGLLFPVQRRVVCAAVKGNKGSIVCGARHFDNIMRMGCLAFNPQTGETFKDPRQEGFIDQFGVFMDRKEAKQVAEAAGQIFRRVGDPESDELFSENLY